MGQRRVLITGCSSGIGRSLCEEFHRRGDIVIATARQPDSIADLQATGLHTYRLDVTQADQIAQLVATLQQVGLVPDVLVNNAGYGLFGPVMDLPPAAIATQFATNVTAQVQLVQAIAPLMKAQGGGLILNIASVSSVFTTPFAGAYAGSKAALRALSEALRMELAPFGIQVVTVHPGAIASKFGDNAQLPAAALPEDSWYTPIADKVQMRATLSQQNATSSDEFARQLGQKVDRGALPPEIWLGKKSWQLPFLKRWLPARLLDRLQSKRFGLNTLR
ncbi:SDR family NAD(P)-dependent oxidoreductase [Leptolyngbya iicbica]|uniref:SDR family NAD(P)-dependent oxidoreductase n=2 Tax=Cyanophyceae TaxID=3028117 RepID=A0A4Q7EAD1_9CYAN|nr:SDR family NAD(P)-dependent oxidoreductase [Leptolyngbya sp. LK]RZM79612.1 SDR family NAD(P)-dependent oxidoreductase [Leptolyngbya sp. LK]